jgi:hypothetical protein
MAKKQAKREGLVARKKKTHLQAKTPKVGRGPNEGGVLPQLERCPTCGLECVASLSEMDETKRRGISSAASRSGAPLGSVLKFACESCGERWTNMDND